MRAAVITRAGAPRFPDRTVLAPAYNQPVITSGGSISSASPVAYIPSSLGWWREKRTGVAESAINTNGSAQTSTAALDLTGSTHYAYPGENTSAPPIGLASNAGQYVETQLKPGGASQAAKWLFNLDIITASPTVLVRLNNVAVSARIGFITVDGLPISFTIPAMNSSLAAGAGVAVLLTFPDSRTRRIRWFGMNNDQGRFGGVAVASGYTVTKPTTQGRTIAFLGDSYTAGGGSTVFTGILSTWMWTTGLRMGAEFLLNAGIGGTGFIAAPSTGGEFINRVSDVLACSPDVVFVAGGRNDTADVTSAVGAVLDALVSVPEVYVVPTSTDAASVRSQMITACATKNRPFLPISVDSYAKVSDGVHMTPTEHPRFGNEAASRALALSKGRTPAAA